MTLSGPLQQRRPPLQVWAGLFVAVVALHALLLEAWTAPPAAATVWRPPVLAVRMIEPPRTPPAPPAQPAPTTPRAAPATPAAPVAPALRVATVPPLEVLAGETAAERAATVVASAPAPEAAAAAAAADTLSAPVYPTRLPPSATLSYALTRHSAGMVAHGTAELHWQIEDGEYALTLDGLSASPALRFELRSRGAVDAAGVAPVRYTDRRRGGAVQAANFQRDKQLISFSGAPLQWPLPAGAQDRASWMLQLAAVVEADALRYVPGAELALFVVGARGDADPWRFTVQPPQDLELPAGMVTAARVLRREPRRRFDLRVEVWLDPQRHHLPVQLRLSNGAGDDVTVWRLVDAR